MSAGEFLIGTFLFCFTIWGIIVAPFWISGIAQKNDQLEKQALEYGYAEIVLEGRKGKFQWKVPPGYSPTTKIGQ